MIIPARQVAVEPETGGEHFARAELAMPAFASTIEDLVPDQPLRGARVACVMPATVAAAVVVRALTRLGANVRWAPSRGVPYASPDADAAASALAEFPLGGQPPDRNPLPSRRDVLRWPDAAGPHLLLDYGSILSRLIHTGTRHEGRSTLRPKPRPQTAQSYAALATFIRGSVEVLPAGARWAAREAAAGGLLYPVMDCSAGGTFAAAAPDSRSLRMSAALTIAVLAHVELFSGGDQAPALIDPPSSLQRKVSAAHDGVLRSRVGKLAGAG